MDNQDTATFEDNWEVAQELLESLDSDNEPETDETPDVYLPVGKVFYNPNKEYIVLIRPETGQTGVFHVESGGNLMKVEPTETDIEDITLAFQFSRAFGL
jgi:hypothetical protein